MDQRFSDLVERLELLEPKKGMGPFLERNFGPIMTILILSIGFVAQWVSTKDYLQNVDARVKVLEGLDRKLDMIMYAKNQRQQSGGN